MRQIDLCIKSHKYGHQAHQRTTGIITPQTVQSAILHLRQIRITGIALVGLYRVVV